MRVLALLLLAAALPAQIPLPGFVWTYSTPSNARGFYFQAPVAFTVTGLQVPDESWHGLQNVVVFKMNAAPPEYPAATSGGQVFYAAAAPSNTILPCSLSFSAGDWLGVIGACGDATTMRNSYGIPTCSSNVLGKPITLTRLLTQTNLVTSGGNLQYSSEAAQPISRVKLFVAGQSSAIEYGAGTAAGGAPMPLLVTTTPPGIGQTAVLQVANANASNQGGLVVLSIGRATIPFLNGTVLVALPIRVTFALPSPVPLGVSTISVPIPSSTSLFASPPLDLQALIALLPDVAMSNGTEWKFGY